MQTYRQFLTEATRHEVVKPESTGGWNLTPGDVYYTNSEGKLDGGKGPALITAGGSKVWMKDGVRHREDGPAIEYKNGDKDWFLFGKHILKGSKYLPDEHKWLLLKGNPENIEIIGQPTLGMQEYVIRLRPDLIGKIDGLDPGLKAKYGHEADLGKIDL